MNANEIYEKIKHIPEDTSFDMPNIEAFVRLAEKLPLNPFTEILEIGTWYGRSAMTWALATNGQVTALDINSETQEKAAKFAEGLGLLESHVNFIIADSQKVSDEFIKSMVDFDVVWIDGNHDYEAAKSDIEKFEPKAKVLICGHDYAPAFPGVIKAVDEYFKDKKVEHDGNIWYVFKNN